MNINKYGIIKLILILSVHSCNFQGLDSTQTSLSPKTIVSHDKLFWDPNKINISPITVYISEDFTIDEQILIKDMGEKWDNEIPSTNMINFASSTTSNKNYYEIDEYRDNEMGVYKSYDWFPELDSQALAITQYFSILRYPGTPYEYFELIHADIIMNYRDYNFTINNSSGFDYDLPSVILHEFGHFFGLGHENNFYIPAVMQPYMSVIFPDRDLYESDINAITDKYEGILSKTLKTLPLNIRKNLDDKNIKIIRGVVELKANGQCSHYQDGKHIHTH